MVVQMALIGLTQPYKHMQINLRWPHFLTMCAE